MARAHASKSKFAERTLAVAKRVGGRQGRALAGVTMEMLQATTRPDVGTRTLVGSQLDTIKQFLGGFSPSQVPYTVKSRMRKHPQVRLASRAAKSPLLRGEIWFDTNSTEVQSLLNRVFIESGFFKRSLRTGLLAIDYGFSAMEQVWDVDPAYEVGWDIPNSSGGFDHHEGRYPNLFIPRVLKGLAPQYTTLLHDRYGEYAGLVYGNPGLLGFSDEQIASMLASGADNILAREKSFVFTLDGDWNQHYGVGRLDSAYDPWYWQAIVYLVCNRWFERKGDPPLIGYAPSNAAIADPGVNKTEFDPDDENESPVLLMSRGLEKLRSTGNLALPSDPYFDDEGKPGSLRAYEVKELDIKDAHPAFQAYIEHLDAKIGRAYLVPDAMTSGHQRGMGSYGSVQTIAEVYVDMQNDTLSEFVEQFDRQMVQPFLRYNNIKDRATLRTNGINQVSKDIVKDTFSKILDADMLAEQAFGRIYPQSLTVMIDRQELARAAGIPFKRPDPDAPAPKPPQDPATAAAGAAAGAGGQPPRGPAKRAAAVTVKMTEDDYVAHKVPIIVRDGVRGKKVTPEQAVAIARAMYKTEYLKQRAAGLDEGDPIEVDDVEAPPANGSKELSVFRRILAPLPGPNGGSGTTVIDVHLPPQAVTHQVTVVPAPVENRITVVPAAVLPPSINNHVTVVPAPSTPVQVAAPVVNVTAVVKPELPPPVPMDVQVTRDPITGALKGTIRPKNVGDGFIR